MELDFLPSHIEDRPGLLMRDPFRFSDAVLVIPPPLVPLLEMFDGEQTEDDLRRALFEMTGDVTSGQVGEHLRQTLWEVGFLRGERFDEMRAARVQEFQEAGLREASMAGAAYPETKEELEEWLKEQRVRPEGRQGVLGIAAPHASPDGSWDSYRAAYGALTPEMADQVFVILGTSHYGMPDRFGLTKKGFQTPFGTARTQTEMVDWLARRAPRATLMEDYCHAVEHSIEFQVMFLQHVYGPEVKILPVLCGAFARSLDGGGRPEEDEGVKEFLEARGDLGATERGKLRWVLGIDLAHQGRRYGGDPAEADRGWMEEVAERDRERLRKVESGEREEFWRLVQENQDDLNWCGSAPLYTFLSALPEARGHVRSYQQWQIDEGSVVTMGAVEFHAQP